MSSISTCITAYVSLFLFHGRELGYQDTECSLFISDLKFYFASFKCVQVNSVCRSQNRVLGPLELQLQVVVSHLLPVLGNKPRFNARAASTHSC